MICQKAQDGGMKNGKEVKIGHENRRSQVVSKGDSSYHSTFAYVLALPLKALKNQPMAL